MIVLMHSYLITIAWEQENFPSALILYIRGSPFILFIKYLNVAITHHINHKKLHTHEINQERNNGNECFLVNFIMIRDYKTRKTSKLMNKLQRNMSGLLQKNRTNIIHKMEVCATFRIESNQQVYQQKAKQNSP